jgi:3-oxoadipate CoA-transferase beta subunit
MPAGQKPAVGWTLAELAARVSADIPDGSYVNLGVGLPTSVSGCVPAGREVLFHSENGIIGLGPRPTADSIDADVIDAGKSSATLVAGAAIFDQAMSFAMIRGGWIDIAVLGAHQVSASGDLANWRRPGIGFGAVGGAMDLASGAKQVWVMMRHTDKQGDRKLVDRCSYPLTGRACVDRIYTELAVISVAKNGLSVLELAPGVDHRYLQSVSEPRLDLTEVA